MRRSIFIALATIAALSVAPARAGVTTSGTIAQTYFVFGNEIHPNGYRYVQLSLVAAVDVGTVGAVVTPGSRFQAYASTQDCDLSYNCTFVGYPQQVVAPLAFNMDPAGNSGTFRAMLAPSSGPARQFDITITRPGYLTPGCNLGLLPCLGVSPWFDPTTTTVGGTVTAFDAIQRDRYLTVGNFGGMTATLLPASAMSSYSFSFSETAEASAP